MGPASAETEIDVPREEVFRLIADLSCRPSFTDHFIADFHLTRLAPTGVGAGARFRFDRPLGSLWADTTIVELDEPYRVVEKGQGGRTNRVPSHTVWEVLEGPGSLARVRVAYWTAPPHPLDRALERLTGGALWYEKAWREALRRLRDRLEAGAAAPARVGVAGGNRHATGVP